jgi:hypothetical protein
VGYESVSQFSRECSRFSDYHRSWPAIVKRSDVSYHPTKAL